MSSWRKLILLPYWNEARQSGRILYSTGKRVKTCERRRVLRKIYVFVSNAFGDSEEIHTVSKKQAIFFPQWV